MFKRLFKIKRYFIVSYSFKNGNGFIEFINTKGNYISKKYIIDYLSKYFKENDTHDFGNIVIDNITELSKRDYKDFMSL